MPPLTTQAPGSGVGVAVGGSEVDVGVTVAAGEGVAVGVAGVGVRVGVAAGEGVAVGDGVTVAPAESQARTLISSK